MIDLSHIASMIGRTKVLVYDTETTGLDWRVDHTVGHVLTFGPRPDESFYLPVRHKGGHNLDPLRVHDMLRASINARHDLHIVGHNLDFDLHFLANDGIVPAGPLEDTLIDSFLWNEHMPSFSLDACCRWFNVQAKKGDTLYEHIAQMFPDEKIQPKAGSAMPHFHRLAGNDPVAVDYATGDGTSTWQLWEALQPKMDEEDAMGRNLRRIWEIECRCIRVLHRMSRRGTKVDEERLEYVKKLIEDRLNRLLEKFPKDFNVGAPSHVKKYFMDAGVREDEIPRTEPSNKFPNGQLSFNEAFLSHHPIGKPIIEVRKLRTLTNSFITPLVERHIWNGRVHPHYNQTRGEERGTITGRLSCDSPNMQQVPKRNKELGALFRSIFVPDPGHEWKSADYGQCEPRLLAHFAQVRTLLDGYMADPPLDAHSAVAKQAGIEREPGKRMNQALVTGAGKNRMMELLYEYGADPMEANRIYNQYFRAMPEIKPFQKKVADIYKRRGFITTLLGRRLHLNDPRFDYQGVNRILQGGNADINKKALADVDELYASEGDHCALLNDVHDDLCHQVPPDCEKTFKRAIELMEDYGPNGQSVYLTVPMVVDVGMGKNWAEASYGVETVAKMFKQMGGRYD